jgi:aspartyl-tRNA(Asn)/glutamyl-tRNA(Gln) amidotransferase subunit C
MTQITEDTVKHVAKLARLELTPDEVGHYQEALSRILALVDELSEVDLSDVDIDFDAGPMPLRPDTLGAPFDVETFLTKSPDTEGRFFRVPQILAAS